MAEKSKEPESHRVPCGTVTGEFRAVVVPVQRTPETDPPEPAPEVEPLTPLTD